MRISIYVFIKQWTQTILSDLAKTIKVLTVAYSGYWQTVYFLRGWENGKACLTNFNFKGNDG